jgi:hypothetical protein
MGHGQRLIELDHWEPLAKLDAVSRESHAIRQSWN